MLRAGKPLSAREVQRGLRLSTPSLALHHLEKLKEYGLIEKDTAGQYFLVEEVRVGLLRLFVKLGTHQIPRYLLYLFYFAGMLGFYVLAYGIAADIKDIYIIILAVSGLVVSAYEVAAAYRMRPF